MLYPQARLEPPEPDKDAAGGGNQCSVLPDALLAHTKWRTSGTPPSPTLGIKIHKMKQGTLDYIDMYEAGSKLRCLCFVSKARFAPNTNLCPIL